jgi:signal transduction histidine kinase
VWGVLRRRWGLILDALIWLGICGLLLVDSNTDPRPLELTGGLVLTTVAVAAGRRLPMVSLAAATTSGFVVLFDFGERVPVWELFLMVSMGYFAGRRTDRARPALAVFAAVALVALPLALVSGSDGLASWGAVVAVIVFAAVFPWQLGRYVRLREQLAVDGWRRAEELETRQHLVADQARLRERARIASDMHDSLGHELSLIAVRAAALEVAGGLDEPQRAAAGELRESAAVATDRLRRILGVLREDAAPTEPMHESLAELVERARSSGMLVRSEVDDIAVSPMVDKALYRVVQESLTNAAKHAPGAAVTVHVRRSDDETVVSVVNDRPPAGELPGPPSNRRGLVGLRERVRLLGGALEAVSRDGGFVVTATLPHDAAPAAQSPDDVTVSARDLERARREVRRSLIQAFAVPIVLFAGLVAVSGIVFLYTWYGSELKAVGYNSFRLGQPYAEVAAVLPGQQRIARARKTEPPEPPGANCLYYGTERSLFNLNYETYRLCFAQGRLVSKDTYRDEDRGNSDPAGTR